MGINGILYKVIAHWSYMATWVIYLILFLDFGFCNADNSNHAFPRMIVLSTCKFGWNHCQ